LNGKLTPLTVIAGSVPILQSSLEELQKQTGIMAKANVGFTPMDTTTAQWNSAMALYPAFMKKLEGMGYTAKPEDQIFKLSDSDVFREELDMRVMQYLLGQIADNTKKQLEGVYNMPEGASFWFPNSALAALQAGAGGGGLTPVNTPGVISAGIKLSGIGMTLNPAVTNPVTSNWNPLVPLGPFPGGVAPWQSNMDQMLQTPGERLGGTTSQSFVDAVVAGLAITAPPSGVVPEGFFTQMQSALNSVFAPFLNWLTGGSQGKPTTPFSTNSRNTGAEVAGLLSRRAEAKTSAINFKLSIDSTTQLICDGRTLATIIKPYLLDDLLNATGTTGSVTRLATI
jgi:hypothetical protein